MDAFLLGVLLPVRAGSTSTSRRLITTPPAPPRMGEGSRATASCPCGTPVDRDWARVRLRLRDNSSVGSKTRRIGSREWACR
eukprot:scaffold1_cov402-Prasinococcus_capsulatus_cf.AAC.35